MIATTTNPNSTRTRWSTGPVRVAEHIAGEDVDAISMPAAFGALVRAELEIMMLAGPVVADGDGSWTFLTQRAEGATLPADLLPLGVRTVPAHTPLTATDRRDRQPAIWWNVVGAARRVAHRTRVGS